MKRKKTKKSSNSKTQAPFRSLFIVILLLALLLLFGKIINQIPNTIFRDTPKSSEKFQAILAKNCKKIQENVWYGYEINKSKVPITVDEKVLALSEQDQDTFTCYFVEDQLTNFLSVTLHDNSQIFIYDKNSLEMGHGGLPYIGSLPITVKQDGDTTYSIALGRGDAGPAIVGYVPIFLRGEKTLHLPNGEIINTNYQTIALQGDNPQLVAFLSKYSHHYYADPAAKELTDVPDEELKNLFFGDLSNLGPEEKAAMEKVTKVLQAIHTY